ncbi:MAG: hypothetical protein GX594_07250 [Pirellulaceae bacterium]|nr:hypothetical protein [Pirellulaceae bacterium]
MVTLERQLDENGNRVTANGSTYTTCDNNQLVCDGTYAYLYDLEGNCTAKSSTQTKAERSP